MSAPSSVSPSTALTLAGVPLKFVSLVTLTLQNSLLAILLHYSRTSTSKKYSSAAAVLLTEILKCVISFAVAIWKTYQGNRKIVFPGEKEKLVSYPSPASIDYKEFFFDLASRSTAILAQVFSSDCWKLSIPAILYVVQNNLQFVAASNLDVATFQVSYQLKILTTALCSVVMLGRRLSISKWIALFFLACGVAIVQLQTIDTSSPATRAPTHVMSPAKGFGAVLAACFTSGLAGVYFEMVLKGSTADLWIRNIQLSLFSIIPAFLPVLLSSLSSSFLPSSPDEPSRPWLFANFGFWAWSTVLCQVFGGLVTALVIKYSDNILKGFATSLSIVLSSMAGFVLFGSSVTPQFVLGAITVLGATYGYNRPSDSPRPQTILPGSSMDSSAKHHSSLEIPVTNLISGRNRNAGIGKRSPPISMTSGTPPRVKTPNSSNLGAPLSSNASFRRTGLEPGTPPTYVFPAQHSYADSTKVSSVNQQSPYNCETSLRHHSHAPDS